MERCVWYIEDGGDQVSRGREEVEVRRTRGWHCHEHRHFFMTLLLPHSR